MDKKRIDTVHISRGYNYVPHRGAQPLSFQQSYAMFVFPKELKRFPMDYILGSRQRQQWNLCQSRTTATCLRSHHETVRS